MRSEIICVGDELLSGSILNSNAQFLSKRLNDLGITVNAQSVVGDSKLDIDTAIKAALKKADLVVLTGGLGPTDDDLTKETVAEYFGKKLVLHKESLERIEEYFSRTGRTMPESNKKQAMLPAGSIVMPNNNGTAPGCIIKDGKKTVMLFPGPPSELKAMFNMAAAPYLRQFSNEVIKTSSVRVFGIGESLIAERIKEHITTDDSSVLTYAKNGEVEIKVTVKSKDLKTAELKLSEQVKIVKELFGENVYCVDKDNLQETVVELLKEQNKKIATAESCTAGILSGLITEISGSSSVFDMGITAYSNFIKTHALGVKKETLEQNGAVSPEVAVEMAEGIRKLTGSDIGVGITGVAGPRSSENKPVGLVYVAITDNTYNFVKELRLTGSRDKIREVSAKTALDMTRRYLENGSEFLSHGTMKGELLRFLWDYKLPNVSKDLLSLEDISVANACVELTDAEIGSLMTLDHDEMDFDEQDVPEMMPVEQYDYILTSTDDEALLDNPEEAPEYLGTEGFKDEFLAATDETEVEEEKPKKVGFIKSVLPQKYDKLSEKIRKTVLLIAVSVLIVSIGLISYYFISGAQQNGLITEAAKIWQEPGSLSKNNKGEYIGFSELIKKNSDIKGWLKINGTKVDNPVYQTNNNDYYINHNMNKQISRYGAIYIDKDSTITKNKRSQNIIFYGHSMADGSMFGSLKQYRNLDFYKKNPIVEFTSLYEKSYYKVFAVMLTNADPKDDNGNVFNYRYSNFEDEKLFMHYVDELKKRSIIDTGVEVLAQDEIITLSTCAYDFDNARLVVVAKKIDKTEQGITRTTGAKYNTSVIYPKAYYAANGQEAPKQITSILVSSKEESSNISSVSSKENSSSSKTTTSHDTSTSSEISSTNTETSSSTKSSSSKKTSSKKTSSKKTSSKNTSSKKTSSKKPSSSSKIETPSSVIPSESEPNNE